MGAFLNLEDKVATDLYTALPNIFSLDDNELDLYVLDSKMRKKQQKVKTIGNLIKEYMKDKDKAKFYINTGTDSILKLKRNDLEFKLLEDEIVFFIVNEINQDYLKIEIGDQTFDVYYQDELAGPGILSEGINGIYIKNGKYNLLPIENSPTEIIATGNSLLTNMKLIEIKIKEIKNDDFRINK